MATATFNDFTWVYGMWFVGNDKGNWMATLGKRDGKIVLEYRFRYYVDDIMGKNSMDKKNWYTLTTKDDSQETLDMLIKGTRDVVAHIERQYGSRADFVDLQCNADDPKIFFELGSRDWTNMRFESAEPIA